MLLHQKADNRFYAYPNEQSFFIADRDLIRKGVFADTKIIDSTGTEFLILSVKEKGWATPILGYSLFIKGRQIKIDFDLELIRQITFVEFKVLVLTRVNSYKQLYSSYDVDEIIELVERADSFEKIIEIFY